MDLHKLFYKNTTSTRDLVKNGSLCFLYVFKEIIGRMESITATLEAQSKPMVFSAYNQDGTLACPSVFVPANGSIPAEMKSAINKVGLVIELIQCQRDGFINAPQAMIPYTKDLMDMIKVETFLMPVDNLKTLLSTSELTSINMLTVALKSITTKSVKITMYIYAFGIIHSLTAMDKDETEVIILSANTVIRKVFIVKGNTRYSANGYLTVNKTTRISSTMMNIKDSYLSPGKLSNKPKAQEEICTLLPLPCGGFTFGKTGSKHLDKKHDSLGDVMKLMTENDVKHIFVFNLQHIYTQKDLELLLNMAMKDIPDLSIVINNGHDDTHNNLDSNPERFYLYSVHLTGPKGQQINIRFNDHFFQGPILKLLTKTGCLKDAHVQNGSVTKAYHKFINEFSQFILENYQIRLYKSSTMASLSLKIYKKRFLKDPIVKISGVDHVNRDIRSSYHGGIVEVYRNTTSKVNLYDVNSLYPFCMLNPSPVGDCTHYVFSNGKMYLDVLFGYFYVKVEAINIKLPPLLSQTIDGKEVRCHGTWYKLYFSEEVKYAMTLGYKITLLEAYSFDKKEIFKDFVKEFYELKSQHPTEVKGQGSKLILNTLYGKLGSKSSPDRVEINSSLIQVSSAISSYARIHMHKLFCETKGELYYTDTDSIVTTVKLDIGNKIGELKLEKDKIVAIFIKPKVYATMYPNKSGIDKLDVKNAGLPNTADRNTVFVNKYLKMCEPFNLSSQTVNKDYVSRIHNGHISKVHKLRQSLLKENKPLRK